MVSFATAAGRLAIVATAIASVVVAQSCGDASATTAPPSSGNSSTLCFPPNFMFGTATSSYQIEGGVNATGRTPSFWDVFCKQVPTLECANVADNFVSTYQSDIQLMKQDGYNTFRFSVSWSRAMTFNQTTGRMQPNPAGLAFYHSVVDELLKSGVQPVLTIFHWDTPFDLYSRGDFNSSSIISHFVDYSDLLFREFGSKIKFWSTFNEPHSYIRIMYINRGSDSDEYTAAHNILLSHAAAVKRFRELKSSGTVRQDAKIGIVVNAFGVPLDASNTADVEAADRFNQFILGIWMAPITTGDYPAVLKQRLGARLPSFTAEQAAQVKGSYDLLQLNFYSGTPITPCDSATSLTACSTLNPGWVRDIGVDESHVPEGAIRGKGACSGSFIFPPSYLEAIEWVHNFDKSADIMLLENGWCGSEEIDDKDKVTYLRTHLAQVHKAITVKKLPIVAYTVWSFMDNYEWGSYKPRYGLYHVTFPDNIGSPNLYSVSAPYLVRTPRTAATFMSSVVKSGCLTLEPGDEKWL